MSDRIEDLLPGTVRSHFLGKAVAAFINGLIDGNDNERLENDDILVSIYEYATGAFPSVSVVIDLPVIVGRHSSLLDSVFDNVGLSYPEQYHVLKSYRQDKQQVHHLRFLDFRWEEFDADSFERGFSETAPSNVTLEIE